MEEFNSSSETHRTLTDEELVKLDAIKEKVLTRDEWRQKLDLAVETAWTGYPATPLSVIFVDIDNLKDVNDEFGHLMGDNVINDLQLSMLLIGESLRVVGDTENFFRPIDVMSYTPAKLVDELSPEVRQRGGIPMINGRIGGDEFAIYCRADEELVQQLAKRLSENFYVRLRQPLIDLKVDISIGTSTLRRGMTAVELLEEADLNLYKDKLSHIKDIDDEAFEELCALLEKLSIRPREVPKIFKKRQIAGEITETSQT